MWDWTSWFLIVVVIVLLVLHETELNSSVLIWISIVVLAVPLIRITFN